MNVLPNKRTTSRVQGLEASARRLKGSRGEPKNKYSPAKPDSVRFFFDMLIPYIKKSRLPGSIGFQLREKMIFFPRDLQSR